MTWAQIVSITFLSATALLVVGLALSWHRSPSVDFDLRQAVTDSVTGKLSVEKVAFMTALCVSTWGFVSLTLEGKLTEWYFSAYMLAFAAARVASQGLSVIKETKNAGTP